MKPRYILVLIAMLSISKIYAQNKELTIGDQLPETTVKVINASNPNLKLSAHKNKLLILDFWNTGCSSCIAAMPHMDSLQKRFGDNIAILPVTDEPEAQIKTFWKTNKYTSRTTLPSVVNDKVLKSYFRHAGFPHEVWIYKGKVIAITDAQHVDAASIQQVLDGKKIDWPAKNDFLRYDAKVPLFEMDPAQVDISNTSIDYSAMEGYIDEMPYTSGVVRDEKNKTVRTYDINNSIFGAYYVTWLNLIKTSSLVLPSRLLTANQIKWEVSDRSKYQYDKAFGYRTEWYRDHAISFESIHPDNGQSEAEIAKRKISDLDALLGLKVRWGKFKEVVYTIEKKTQAIKVSPSKTAKQYMLSQVWAALNGQVGNPYVFMDDAKTPDVKVSLTIKSWTDIISVKKELEKQGYTLREEQREVDKFVFTEINGGLIVDAKARDIAIAKRKVQAGMANPAPEDNTTFLEANKKKPGVITLPSGLQYKVLTAGTGAKPALTDKVSINYQGTLVNGKIFDSSYERGKPSTFPVNDVIPGWIEALQLMPAGSKWEIYIPANLAYGSHTNRGSIPPNSTLIFELELKAIFK